MDRKVYKLSRDGWLRLGEHMGFLHRSAEVAGDEPPQEVGDVWFHEFESRCERTLKIIDNFHNHRYHMFDLTYLQLQDAAGAAIGSLNRFNQLYRQAYAKCQEVEEEQ